MGIALPGTAPLIAAVEVRPPPALKPVRPGDNAPIVDNSNRNGSPSAGLPSPWPIRAPRGNTRTAKGWLQEAAKRMLMNNLDPEVAEAPENLVVYGGRGKAARDWQSYHRIIDTLDRLENDETLLVQSGKPVGVFRTHEMAPRVLMPTRTSCPSGPPGTSSTAWTGTA